jgi:TRAP-type C4-dicarboxylate transport system substrate-binding protein
VTFRSLPFRTAVLALSLAGSTARAQTITLKLATLAPDGSGWHEALKDLGQRWAQVSGGRVQLKIYAGGVAGDETAVVSKMRIGQFGAALVTSHGVTDITTYVRAFGLPRMIRSYEEVDHALEALRPALERRLEEKGFVALGWTDAGMVRFFGPEPTGDIARIRAFKMFTWAGDSDTTELWRSAGFHAVPLPSTEVMTGLQTGLINAIPTTPAIALASQWYAHVRCLVDMPIAPLVGTLLVTKRDWERIPAALRPALREEAAKTIARLRAENRRLDREAIEAMSRRGLRVVTPTASELEAWNRQADDVNRSVRGRYLPAEAYDELVRALDEFRRRPARAAK